VAVPAGASAAERREVDELLDVGDGGRLDEVAAVVEVCLVPVLRYRM